MIASAEEFYVEGSSKLSFRSYFALIPVFKRKQSTAERNIIKVIHRSRICKSNPILKTLLIENIRICCIVVESSGNQSVKILYASVPFMFALISKANPKFEKLLKSENISLCLKILKESNFDSVLDNFYQTTVFIHRGIKKLYPTICVTMLKDYLLYSEKSLSYLLKLILHVLKSTVDFLHDNIIPIFHYLCRQNYVFVTYISDIFPHLITAVVKYSIITTLSVQKSTIFTFQLLKKILQYFNQILDQFYADSSLSYFLKKLYLFLKLSITHVRSTDACSHMEFILLQVFQISKPYIWDYFQNILAIMKNFILASLPVVKSGIKYAVKEIIPLVRKFIENNFENILIMHNSVIYFLYENSQYLKSFCCHSCDFIFSLLSYLYKMLQDALPHIIRFSSNAAISFMTCSTFILENCIYCCHIFCNNAFPILKSQKKSVCEFSRRAFKILKTVYKMFSKLAACILVILRTTFNEFMQLIHLSSPAILACLYEMNSSMLYASSEVVAKSFIAVKGITPSIYSSLKTVTPHTARAANEIIKSSRKSAVVVFPAIWKGVLTVRPEVKQCIVVLFSDGNKACLEVVEVTYSASCQLKDVALSVTTNIPVVYKAIYEVLKTTGCAAVEISTTSISAQSRMIKDLSKAHELVYTSFVLAEQEILATYMEFILEINSIVPHSKRSVLSDRGILKHVAKYFLKLCCNCSEEMLILFRNILNLLDSVLENSAVHFKQIFKLLMNTFYQLFSLYTQVKIPKIDVIAQNIQKLVWLVFRNINYITSSVILCLYDYIDNNMTNINDKVVHSISVSMSKIWNTFKSNVCVAWTKACEMGPEIWIVIEYVASLFWNFIVENVPGVWKAWKIMCSQMWKLIHDLTPYIWFYLSSIIPVLWSSGRDVTKYSWNTFINVSASMWQHSVSLTSTYWMLSKTYLPIMWFVGCEETKKGWNLTCCVIEHCWNFTVESCFSSWNFLHRSVAKSWRQSLVFTKTAYCMFTTTGSVLQKSFYVCRDSKKYVYVMMLDATPHLSDFSVNSVPKLLNIFQILKGKEREKNFCNSDVSYGHSAKESGLSSNVKSCIVSIVNYFSCVEKILDYEIFIYPRLFKRNRAKF